MAGTNNQVRPQWLQDAGPYAECEKSTFKQRKGGSYKIVLEDDERVHWETDTAEAEDGYCNVKKNC